jgi:hypothetical protein
MMLKEQLTTIMKVTSEISRLAALRDTNPEPDVLYTEMDKFFGYLTDEVPFEVALTAISMTTKAPISLPQSPSTVPNVKRFFDKYANEFKGINNIPDVNDAR